jgi:hypothetical protein
MTGGTNSWRKEMKRFFYLVLVLATGIALAGCGKDKSSPAAPQDAGDVTTFDSDLDGWSAHTSSIDWGMARWIGGSGGCVELDGVGNNDPGPNAWIEKQVTLPAKVTSPRYKASAHDAGSGSGFLRARLKDEGDAYHTLVDWEEYDTGDAGYDCVARSADLSPFAGQTVTLYFELDDADGGGNNQVCVDDVDIRRSN